MASKAAPGPVSAQDALQARIVAGDAGALDELFRSSKDALGRYLASRCGNVTDAEDALQNTFENATRFIEGYRGDASPRSWLFRVFGSMVVNGYGTTETGGLTSNGSISDGVQLR